uniref:Tudor-knot domain-containing protein n=1 Tax=Hippocampus comes TaxID=109280 RepID=A0A3Q2YW40_HIPCM
MSSSGPQNRTGIKFEVGAQLQARDRHKNWYSATIDKVDYDKERVLIHYRRWSRRHDEWFHWNSPYLRPLERLTLRGRRGLNPTSNLLFVLSQNSKFFVSWKRNYKT